MNERAVTSLSDRRSAVADARAALTGLSEVLWQCRGEELAALLGEVDGLAVLASAARVAVTNEAVERGEVAASQAGSTAAWVRTHATSLAGEGFGELARAVKELAVPSAAPVHEAVLSGRVSVPVALAVVGEMARLEPLLADNATAPVVEGLLTMGATDGRRGVRRLGPALLARYGLTEELEREADHARRHLALEVPVAVGYGLWRYVLTADTETKAMLEAALSPLSAPQPDPDGAPDLRSAGQRRGRALVALVSRALAAVGSPSVACGVKTTLVVTMGWEDLRDRLGTGLVTGSTCTGDQLTPETVRRLACQAQLVPIVLGGDGEVLDVGRTERLVTLGLLKQLWVRDGACSFPGCSVPAAWTDAHHVHHWADGGRTEPGNLALLCGRHHTVVHRDRLVAEVSGSVVEWDRVPGSYDRWLARRHACAAEPDH